MSEPSSKSTGKDGWAGWLGVEQSPVSHTERIVSVLGAFAGIYAVFAVSGWFVEDIAFGLIVASMGASAVLLFAVPRGPLSQPWAVLGGHLLSALVGVSCAKFIGNAALGAALAVALGVGAMHYFRCIHPPGGATALTAVLGGPSIAELGYQYVVTPVLLNTLLILIVAVLFNYPFVWRRYPRVFKVSVGGEGEAGTSIAHDDLVYALSQVDSFVDVSEQDLLTIYALAAERAENVGLDEQTIRLGHYYSNGKYGVDWSVRQIVDASGAEDDSGQQVIYKTVAGNGRRTSGVVSRAAFARWAKHEVYRDDENWRRVDSQDEGSEY